MSRSSWQRNNSGLAQAVTAQLTRLFFQGRSEEDTDKSFLCLLGLFNDCLCCGSAKMLYEMTGGQLEAVAGLGTSYFMSISLEVATNLTLSFKSL